jgi:hypothetical protein
VTLSPVEQLCYQQSKRAFCEAAFQLSLQQSVEVSGTLLGASFS